jgi:hypothetical protein
MRGEARSSVALPRNEDRHVTRVRATGMAGMVVYETAGVLLVDPLV